MEIPCYPDFRFVNALRHLLLVVIVSLYFYRFIWLLS